MSFDAALLVSFGGPEGPDDVEPFLENVLRGRPVSPERIKEVARHYDEFGGKSPINDINRRLLADLRQALDAWGTPIPVYWGNRNWQPYLADTIQTMAKDRVRAAAAIVTSAYDSYSGRVQYLEDIAGAQATVGHKAPAIVMLPPFYDRPGFVAPFADGLRSARATAGPDAAVLMTAHSIPIPQAERYPYESQLRFTAHAVMEAAGEDIRAEPNLAFQSRSGPPSQPWLEPDINDAIRALPPSTPAVIVVPIGFVSDHMEVVYDLDRQAAATAAQRGMKFARTPTPGADPRFVEMVCDLLDEAGGASEDR